MILSIFYSIKKYAEPLKCNQTSKFVISHNANVFLLAVLFSFCEVISFTNLCYLCSIPPASPWHHLSGRHPQNSLLHLCQRFQRGSPLLQDAAISQIRAGSASLISCFYFRFPTCTFIDNLTKSIFSEIKVPNCEQSGLHTTRSFEMLSRLRARSLKKTPVFYPQKGEGGGWVLKSG